MNRSRYLAWSVAVGAALLAAGCGSSSSSSLAAAPASPTASSAPTASIAASPSSAGPATPTARDSTAAGSAGAPAPAPAASAPAASVNSSSCAKYAATHMFAQVTAVKANADGSLTVTAHHASVVCGGLDDLHYNIATVTETGTVTPAGTVRMLAGASQEQTVAHADVSSRLATDNWGRIFMVQGPLTAITALTEMYHP